MSETPSSLSGLIDAANQAAQSTAEAHQKFLKLSSDLTRSYAETFNLQTKLLQRAIEESDESLLNSEIETAGSEDTPKTDLTPKSDLPNSDSRIPTSDFRLPTFDIPPSKFESPASVNPHSAIRNPQSKTPLFSREACLEFAVGSAAKVLGSEFTPVDSYEVRVRLPDEPLMLVDRVLTVEGAKGSLGSGNIVTEHDVLPGAWYLDGGHAPVCISVEAGQADLFLCAYLGIDLKVQGRRSYRLLDATVKFHRELPVPGETIRYEIEIDKFLRQGETYLFLFHFSGFIGNVPLITMTNGKWSAKMDKRLALVLVGQLN